MDDAVATPAEDPNVPASPRRPEKKPKIVPIANRPYYTQVHESHYSKRDATIELDEDVLLFDVNAT